MSFPVLNSYLRQLRNRSADNDKLWLDSQGRVQGEFLNCSLTSIFQPITNLSRNQLLGYEAHSHSYSKFDRGLSVWQILMNAANDDESVELDRLARLIHVLNFFRQDQQASNQLLIDVHDRLLAAVSSNHGAAFRRIVSSLDLSPSRIILQLPNVKPSQNWALTQVVDNYKLNGFPVATRAMDINEALRHTEALRPALIRIDISRIGNGERLAQLIEKTAVLSVKLLFTRIEFERELDLLSEVATQASCTNSHLYVQGSLISGSEADLSFEVTDAYKNSSGKDQLSRRPSTRLS